MSHVVHKKVSPAIRLGAVLTLLLFAVSAGISGDRNNVARAADSQTIKLSPANYVCWWSHDATGYHPSLYLRYRNDSSVDLSGARIQWQARFTDLGTGQVTVARGESARGLRPKQEQTQLLTGPTPYELMIDKRDWPNMECKCMCRIGDVGDEGTQELVIGRLEKVVMTEDEAGAELLRRPDFRRRETASAPAESQGDGATAPDKPVHHHLVEKALTAQLPILPLSQANKVKTPEKPILKFINGKQPGLGDEYAYFEQAYGKPADYGVSPSSHWTWAKFSPHDLSMDIYAGSKSGGTAPTAIVASVAASELQNETQLVYISKTLAGKLKSQVPESFHRSVKYLSSGRVEFGSADAPTLKIVYFPPRSAKSDEANYVLILSREPGAADKVISDSTRGVEMLRFIQPLVGSLN